ncbi:secreted protein [Christiangramia forsetii KT0803]|uniref:Secreted protein n=1 Tax=Christiangramia forsetii (strain DSM 17595 / CGMCC 1.15422 / KT0803) TaxID=411154 RepID=A0M1S6_CHRFK|nr:secreted protein [Christiangramia forsetii KT0803]
MKLKTINVIAKILFILLLLFYSSSSLRESSVSLIASFSSLETSFCCFFIFRFPSPSFFKLSSFS